MHRPRSRGGRRRRLERGHAPELNPLEAVWGNVKGRELAKLYAAHPGEGA